jgi:hypothetical protein
VPVDRDRPDGQLALARVHQVRVALDRVDLAVVREHPERLRPLPRRHRVRREAGVEHRQRRLEAFVREVRIEVRESRSVGHRLVDDGEERAARRIERRLRRDRVALSAPPEPVGELLGRAVLEATGTTQDRLHQLRLAAPGLLADRRRIVRDVPPADEIDPLAPARALEDETGGRTGGVPLMVARTGEEEEGQAQRVRSLHRGTLRRRPGPQQVLRELGQHTCTVTGHRIRGHGTAVTDPGEALERQPDDVTRSATVRPRDEAHTAGVTF